MSQAFRHNPDYNSIYRYYTLKLTEVLEALQMLSIGALARGGIVRSTYDTLLAFGSAFRGVYQTMEEARAAAPRGHAFGYDNQAAAELYQHCLTPRWGDYAVMYWLARTIEDGSELLDLGGNIGVLFYTFQKYLRFAPGFRWVVYDLPASIEAGKRIAGQRPHENLAFTTRLEDCRHPDILLASGAVQYIDRPLSDILTAFATRPRHVLVNKLPAYDGFPFVTLQNIGPSICPYRVFNRTEFVASLLECGYELADQWDISELHCRVPLHPSRTASYSGMYFRRSDGS